MNIWTWLTGWALVMLGGCQGGCAPALPPEMRDAAKAIVTSITDQASWQGMVANVNGQVIQPGVRGYAGVIYLAGGELTGVSGQVGISASGQGTGKGPSPEALATIRGILERKGLAADVIDTAIAELSKAKPVTP